MTTHVCVSVTQLRVAAYDTAYPSHMTTSDIVIKVIRNANPPVFRKENYIETITEKFPIGDNILQVAATDKDGVSLCLPKAVWLSQ